MGYVSVEAAAFSVPLDQSRSLELVGQFMEQTFPGSPVRRWASERRMWPSFVDGIRLTLAVQVNPGVGGDAGDTWSTLHVVLSMSGAGIIGGSASPRETEEAQRLAQEFSSALQVSLERYVLEGHFVAAPVRLRAGRELS